MNPPEDRLQDAAGDYVAGDLNTAEAKIFRQHLDSNDKLRKDVAFWQGLQGQWQDPVSTESLGEHFADAVITHAQREAPQPRIIHLPLWAVIAGSAAAAALVIALLLPSSRAPGAMYGEDGFAVSATAVTGSWDQALPRALVNQVSVDSRTLSDVPAHTRPYAGIWTKPIKISHNGTVGGGHLILRVAGGSPADRCGLRPGDVIRSIADCPVFTPGCIAHQLEKHAPGTSLLIDYWRPSSGEEKRVTLTLETLYE
jgi:hypothetical protein